MSQHTLAEAQARLPELIARAGEEVVIALEDGAAVGLSMIGLGRDRLPPAPPKAGAELLAWLDRVRVGQLRPGFPDAAATVRQMRDEDA